MKTNPKRSKPLALTGGMVREWIKTKRAFCINVAREI